MTKNTERLSLTAGLLTLPNAQGDAWFEVFVSVDRLHFEIEGGTTRTYSAPVFLLDAAEKRGYVLPEASVQAIERLALSGVRVLTAMVDSIKTEMHAIARDPRLESEWCDHPERCIWRLIKTHVPADIQLAVYALLKRYRHYFDEKGAVVMKRGNDDDNGIPTH